MDEWIRLVVVRQKRRGGKSVAGPRSEIARVSKRRKDGLRMQCGLKSIT